MMKENVMKKYIKNEGKIFRGTVTGSANFQIGNSKVTCAIVEDQNVRILIPYQELDVYLPYSLRKGKLDRQTIENFTRKMINTSVPFVVLGTSEEENIVVASRKQALEILRNKNKFAEGDIVIVNVVGASNEYVVCEFDGYIGTVGKKDFSYATVGNLVDEVRIGERRKAKILTLNDKNCFLGFKQTEPNPFDEYVINSNYYSKGGTYTGTIKQIIDDKIYVNLAKGLTVAAAYPFRNSRFNKKIGDSCIVTITQINKDKKHLFGAIN